MELGAESNRLRPIAFATKPQRLLHECSANPAAPRRSRHRNPPYSDHRWGTGHRDQAEIAGELALGSGRQMPGAAIEAVEVGIGRALLDDEDAWRKRSSS